MKLTRVGELTILSFVEKKVYKYYSDIVHIIYFTVMYMEFTLLVVFSMYLTSIYYALLVNKEVYGFCTVISV